MGLRTRSVHIHSVCILMTSKNMYIYQYVPQKTKACRLLTSDRYKHLPPLAYGALYVHMHTGV